MTPFAITSVWSICLTQTGRGFLNNLPRQRLLQMRMLNVDFLCFLEVAPRPNIKIFSLVQRNLLAISHENRFVMGCFINNTIGQEQTYLIGKLTCRSTNSSYFFLSTDLLPSSYTTVILYVCKI